MNVGHDKKKLDVAVHPTECIGDIVSCLGNCVEFVVTEVVPDTLPEPTQAAKRNTVNPFNLMMAAQRSRRNLPQQYPVLKSNRKIDLKNDILKWLARNELGWARDSYEQQGQFFVETLASVLWSIDGHHDTLSDRGCGLPAAFDGFKNYRQPEKSKKRKRDHCNLEYRTITEHSQALFHLAGSSYMKRDEWKVVHESVLQLGDNLKRYAVYLDRQVDTSQAAHSRIKVFATDVDIWEIYPAKPFVSPSKAARYRTLHQALLHSKPYEAIFLNGFAPADRRRRNEYVNELVFSCKTVRYTYTGLHSHLHFIWKLDPNDNESQRQQKNDNTKTALKSNFPVYHSRAMRKEFVQHFGRVTGVKSGILREAYRRLTADQAAARNLTEQEVDQRIQTLLDNDDPDLVWDLRLNNSGRPEEYQYFLEKCQKFVQGKVETAVDDRRHDAVDKDGDTVVHLAMALSAKDLHEQVKKECPEGTPIPSVQWLRLQFWPTRCSSAAHKNTGKIKVKMMVAARQFRKSHVDAHYASAVFRYEKEFCVQFREFMTFVCEDDKHTVKVGEPGFPVAAVERGKRVIVGLSQSLEVGDHDFTKFSLSPSVSLAVDVPESIEGSFYHGQVHVGLKENAFEPSSALRHAAELSKALGSHVQPLECHYHDGGPDHNLRFTRTQLCQIAYFLARDLDVLNLVQTPPHHSWKNPAERVMSNLNLGLQGVGIMRQETATMERELKGANNLKGIRELAKKHPELKEEVGAAVKPTKELLNSVFQRLHLKDIPFKIFSAASTQDLRELADNIKRIDEEFDTTPLIDTSKPCPKPSPKIKAFMDRHCRAGQYQFGIKKCQDDHCVCGKPRVPQAVFSQLHHLPFPVPQRDRYQPFEV